jgi:hypothetical protein
MRRNFYRMVGSSNSSFRRPRPAMPLISQLRKLNIALRSRDLG